MTNILIPKVASLSPSHPGFAQIPDDRTYDSYAAGAQHGSNDRYTIWRFIRLEDHPTESDNTSAHFGIISNQKLPQVERLLMKKFLVLYRAPISASEQMANTTPEQAKVGMDAWMDWATKAGSAILDVGAPLGDGRGVSGVSAQDDGAKIVGYSILQGQSIDAATQLLQEHPHGRIPNFSIEIFECLQLPTEAAKQPSKAA